MEKFRRSMVGSRKTKLAILFRFRPSALLSENSNFLFVTAVHPSHFNWAGPFCTVFYFFCVHWLARRRCLLLPFFQGALFTLSMAATAIHSFALLRNYAVSTRAISNIKALPVVSSNFNSFRCLLPRLSRRSPLCTKATPTHDEEAAAKAAAASADTGAPTIFDKIIAKEIPSTIVYEDEKVLAFRDINPQAPVHVLVIPKFRDGLTQLGKAEARHGVVLGQLLYAAKIVAEREGILDGFRVVINNGPSACQSIYHLHLHVLGGREMKWPAG